MSTDVLTELKGLRLYGMASAWGDLLGQGETAALQSARWLLEHLLQAEGVDRAMRSVSYQMKAARFPMHRDLAGFDFEASSVERTLISQLANLAFTDDAHNVVLIGGPGTGKTHLASALGIAGITRHGKRVRFFSTVDLVNALEQEKGKCPPNPVLADRLAARHRHLLNGQGVFRCRQGYLGTGRRSGARGHTSTT